MVSRQAQVRTSKTDMLRLDWSFSESCWFFFPHSGSQKSGSAGAPGLPIYVDLAYIPNHCSAKNVDQEFFKRVRSAHYVVSGNDAASGEPSRGVLDALLDGKAQWGSNLQVRLNIEANLKITPVIVHAKN